MANAVATVFGGKKIKDSSASVSNMAGGMTDVASGMTDVASGARDTSTNLDNANKSANKLKRTLAGFDQLNVLSDTSSDSGSGSSGASGVGSGGGGDITGLANASYISTEEEVQSGIGRAEGYFKQISDIYHKWFDNLPKLQINFDKDRALEDIKNIGLDITNVIAGLGSFVITIGINLANDLNIGQLANDFLGLVSSVTGLASTLVDILVPAFERFYDIALKPIVEWIGEKLSDAFQYVTEKINDFAKFLDEHKEGIQGWIDVLAKFVKVV